MKHEDHPFRRIVDSHLKKAGGFYTFDDILTAIYTGHMQSFAEGDSWVVTQIIEFPQRKALDLVLLVGNRKDYGALTESVVAFAKSQGLTCILSSPRVGFIKESMRPEGWRVIGFTAIKEI